MAGNVLCPRCGQVYTLQPNMVGQPVQCVRCGQVFQGPPAAATTVQPRPVQTHPAESLGLPPTAGNVLIYRRKSLSDTDRVLLGVGILISAIAAACLLLLFPLLEVNSIGAAILMLLVGVVGVGLIFGALRKFLAAAIGTAAAVLALLMGGVVLTVGLGGGLGGGPSKGPPPPSPPSSWQPPTMPLPNPVDRMASSPSPVFAPPASPPLSPPWGTSTSPQSPMQPAISSGGSTPSPYSSGTSPYSPGMTSPMPGPSGMGPLAGQPSGGSPPMSSAYSGPGGSPMGGRQPPFGRIPSGRYRPGMGPTSPPGMTPSSPGGYGPPSSPMPSPYGPGSPSSSTPGPSGAGGSGSVSTSGDAPSMPVELTPTAAAALNSVVLVEHPLASGSGFALPGNLVVTNAHVVDGAFPDEIKLQFGAENTPPKPITRIVYIDRARDLCLMEADTGLPGLPVRESYSMRVGQQVVLMGNPSVKGGMLLRNATNHGRLARLMRIDGQDYYQIDASVNPGWSGGPVIDNEGRVIAVVAMKANDKAVDEIRGAMQRLDEGFRFGRGGTGVGITYGIPAGALSKILQNPKLRDEDRQAAAGDRFSAQTALGRMQLLAGLAMLRIQVNVPVSVRLEARDMEQGGVPTRSRLSRMGAKIEYVELVPDEVAPKLSAALKSQEVRDTEKQFRKRLDERLESLQESEHLADSVKRDLKTLARKIKDAERGIL